MDKYIVKTIFTKDECNEILKMDTELIKRKKLSLEFELSYMNGFNKYDVEDVVVKADEWVYDRLNGNMDIGNFANCTGIWPLILKVYNEGDKVGMHVDDCRGIKRVTCSTNLNDDYGGGELQVFNWNISSKGNFYSQDDSYDVETLTPAIGQMVQLPMIVPHRVTEVTFGVRKQLVTWFTGEVLNW